MMTSWKHFPRYWTFVRWIHRSSVNPPHKGCAWINSWVNNLKAGDLRRHRAHYNVIVMAYEFVNLGALKSVRLSKQRIFQCMGKVFYVEFQRVHLKFHLKYLTHTWKDRIFTQCWKFKNTQIYELEAHQAEAVTITWTLNQQKAPLYICFIPVLISILQTAISRQQKDDTDS